MNRYYIGLAPGYHDPAMAIVAPDGEVLYAEATERPTQCKRAMSQVPDDLIRAPELIRTYCEPDAELALAMAWEPSYLDAAKPKICLDDRFPLLRFDVPHGRPAAGMPDATWPWPAVQSSCTLALSALALAGHGIAGNPRITNPVQVRYFDHHLTHAAYACFSSPYETAACAVIDGWGQTGSTSFFRYRGGQLELLPTESESRGSLGLLYSLVCDLAGFSTLKGEEWKVMGLAPYGGPNEEYDALLRPIIRVEGLSLSHDRAAHTRCVEQLFPRIRRAGTSPLEAADLAFVGQQLMVELAGELLCNFHERVGGDKLVFTGGCALNSSLNGQITRITPFEEVHVPSAPGDDGNALGAALVAVQQDNPDWRPPEQILSPYLGSSMCPRSLDDLSRFSGLENCRHLPDRIAQEAATLLAQGKIIGWVQGRAEFGPRALGNRSILADPRDPLMKSRLNDSVKYREPFRPFAPSILHEEGPEYFEDYQDSPFMSKTLRWRAEARRQVPAVVHENGTGRLQSVHRDLAPRFHDLLQCFHRLAGVPLLLNTSFNVMGKPIIHSLQDALGVFFTTGLDALVIEEWLIEK